jgi:hypothetical protein
MESKMNILKKIVLTVLFSSLCVSAFTQALVTHGGYVLWGTVLVQYQGRESNVIIPANLGITEIAEQTFSNSGIESIIIPEGVRILREGCFSDTYNLRSVTIPASVIYIENYVFDSSVNLQQITVNPNNNNYASVDGVLYNKAKTMLIRFPLGKAGSYDIPSTVTIIGSYAFCDCTSLSFITIPASVITVGSRAFSDCTSLASITIPAGLTIPIDTAPDNFSSSYDENGKKAGTYTLTSYFGRRWSFGTSVTAAPQATNITLGSVYNAELQRNIAQWYRITLSSGMFIAYTESEIDTEMWLYNAAGDQIAYDDDSGTDGNAKISRNVSAGTYYIKVGGYGSDSGPYSMHVSLGR